MSNLGVGMAYLNISAEEFWDMTPREFQQAMESVRQKHDHETRQRYELARFGSYLDIQPHLSERDRQKIKSPQDLISFYWEKDSQSISTEMVNEAELFKLRAMAWGTTKAIELQERDETKA